MAEGERIQEAAWSWPPETSDATDRPRVRTHVESGVGYLVIDRPEKRNALDAATRKELIAALDGWRDDDNVRVVVITGVGKTFAAGADLAEMQARSLETQRAFITPPHVYSKIAASPMPVIACVNGHALGAGCELMMACDLRVAGDKAKIGQPETRLGLIPGGGGTQRLPRLVGLGRALRMVLTGDAVDAAEAERIGLVEEVVTQDALHGHVRKLAETLATRSPVALRIAKETVRAAAGLPLEEGLRVEVDAFMEAFASEDAKEGVAAFVEGRDPRFTGR